MKSTLSPRILIADDYPVVRQGVALTLRNEFPLAVISESSSTTETMNLLRKQEWDLVITDLNMPGRDGLELIEDMKHEKMRVPVLVLSMHPEEHMAVRALRSGASGYLNKASSSEQVIAAVKKILDGGKYITPVIAEHMLYELTGEENREPHTLLSNREYETAKMLSSGKSISAIAAELSLSTPTISTYRARILEKMEMKNTTELISYFIKHSLV